MVRRVLESVPLVVASAFPSLPERVRRVVVLCDGTRTLDGVCALSPLSAADTRAVVAALERRGLVVGREGAPARRRRLTPVGTAWLSGALEPAPFSDDEERFFASSIDHLISDEFQK